MGFNRILGIALLGAVAGFGAIAPSRAIDVSFFEDKVFTETLDNGLTILVYERPTAPVVSFFTHVNVGSAQEVPGITGLAHMFEHMAFKGTSAIGTKDYKSELKAMARTDAAYAAYSREREKLRGFDPEKLAQLKKEFEEARDAAQEFVARDEYSEIVDRAGGRGMNAFTSADTTGYMMAMPANKVELWAHLESGRFLDPVFREFYKERDVVMEERRMRTESQPIGRLIEQFITTAFQAHPYGQPTVGHMSDLEAFSREDARAFYETYYTPANMTVAVAGDVKAKEVMPMLKRYFSRLEPGPEPPAVRTVEPEQVAERVVTLHDASQPFYLEGYHRPSMFHPDDAAYNAMASILSSGRTSRLYKRLVDEEKIAAAALLFSGFPGTKYPHMMMFIGVPAAGHDNEEIQASIRDEIQKIRNEPVTDEELQMVKTQAKANLIRGLQSNGGVAQQLATFQATHGDWRELFRSVEKIERVSTEDIMRVAKATFTPNNRTVAMIVNEDDATE